jgi:thiamine-phosphate pyrophosphorylase|tara:strand:+ start:651 stop:1265 length:615 start_codon:yes stop_codon:yes gene_type:complete
LRYNNKKFIYLISPLKIDKSFYVNLIKIFKQNKVKFFQLRLKRVCFKEKLAIGRKIKKLCKKFHVKLLINDDVYLTKQLNADGCHLGQKDMNIFEARKIIGNKIIGVTCHNSIKLAKNALKRKANYLAFGAFYSSKTKKTKYKANFKILKKIKEITKIPVVAIGGINSNNYKKLLLNNANFLAISGYVWNNKNLKPFEAIQKLK